MIRISLLAALTLTSTAAFAADSDPGYGPRAAYYSPGVNKPGAKTSIYYKPTMRYFGKGYTVTYRYVQFDSKVNRIGMSVFDNMQYVLPVGAVQAAGATQRVTHYSPGGQPRTVTPVTEKRAVEGAKQVPVIGTGGR